ncbi:uncharacterized protein EV420DRAFT_1487494 [Desarmillaria tabescens]|uniref:Uncharacterized protein n=1 Tax=Armillaria tabescens TaxID=1929756 RepID=A0AA39J6V4_ARMTA|nr:uncharacterized protein EV420DRAFT_1487494 [Desarmillaria tabescens]KAK0436467.1 hypothetical protein EV420DRAFT_1487494 [Desarmillaria tabescens]
MAQWIIQPCNCTYMSGLENGATCDSLYFSLPPVRGDEGCWKGCLISQWRHLPFWSCRRQVLRLCQCQGIYLKKILPRKFHPVYLHATLLNQEKGLTKRNDAALLAPNHESNIKVLNKTIGPTTKVYRRIPFHPFGEFTAPFLIVFDFLMYSTPSPCLHHYTATSSSHDCRLPHRSLDALSPSSETTSPVLSKTMALLQFMIDILLSLLCRRFHGEIDQHERRGGGVSFEDELGWFPGIEAAK